MTRRIDSVPLSVADHLNDLVAVFDTAGRCVYLNRTGRRLLRVATDDDAPGIHIDDLAGTDDRERFATIRAGAEGGETWTGSLAMTSTAGAEFTTRSTLSPVVLADASPGVSWVAKDTTTDGEVIRQLQQRTFFDPVTGLPHRSIFLDRLDLLLRRPPEGSRVVGVLLVSPDRFKERINRFAHGAADVLVKLIAQRLPGLLAPNQNLHRWGDENFVVLCDSLDDENAATAVGEAIQAAFEEPFDVGDGLVFLSASVGVAVGRPGDASPDSLIRQAEVADQLAQQIGGGSIRVFDADLRARALRQAELEDALRGAAERGELVLHYQPEILMRTSQIVACEALVRWQHPEWGLVSPADFIPIAETSNLIVELGDWVMRQALTQGAEWAKSYPDRPPVMVAVNISSRQFVADDFEQKVGAVLGDTGILPSTVCLEITEGVLLDDAEETIQKLNRLKKLGVHLAVDDFGTGYSSLSYLRRFPVDILKVDQAFVAGLGQDPGDSAIVQAVVHMGQALRMTTLAEGVETAHHVIELRELGCDIAQGYHFSRPLPADRFAALLDAGDEWQSVPKP